MAVVGLWHIEGTGVDQSFPKAVLWYTQALDRGHTPAAYSLAVMHLNGIGTVRDCDIAVNLLKKVSAFRKQTWDCKKKRLSGNPDFVPQIQNLL
eukprot:2573301-Amphidinium_carterae.1